MASNVSNIDAFVGMLDRSISAFSATFPGVWVLALLVVLAYTFKELMAYHKGHHQNKVEVHDSLDAKSFEQAVLPLIHEFNSEVMLTTIDNLEFNGNETPGQIIADYEEKKKEVAEENDFSNLEQSLNVTDALKSMQQSQKESKVYDRCYNHARACLKIGAITLSINTLVGAALIFSTLVLSSVGARYLIVAWALLLAFNTLTAFYYIVNKSRMDGFLNEN